MYKHVSLTVIILLIVIYGSASIIIDMFFDFNVALYIITSRIKNHFQSINVYTIKRAKFYLPNTIVGQESAYSPS